MIVVVPAHYGSRPQHLHYRVSSPDGSTVDVSQMYFAFDRQYGKIPRYVSKPAFGEVSIEVSLNSSDSIKPTELI